jgi:exosortase
MSQSTPVHIAELAGRFARWPTFLAMAVLAFVWLRLILHLRIVWTVDEQYAYGWAVPFLCALLFWRRMRSGSQQSALNSQPAFGKAALQTLSVLILVVFLLTRLVEEANPDWRLVSWALALEVIALSLIAVCFVGGRAALKNFAFPVLFFLVAVPWPTPMEQPLIQLLTRGIVAATVELLNLFGFAALTHGNVIETAGGFVDVDEACSGIRSLQSALMLALFFGEWHRLRVPRRAALLGLAFGLACVFNLARTVVLSLVAVKQGSSAVTRWHDPAGVVILLGCFFGVWLAASWLARAGTRGEQEDKQTRRHDKTASYQIPPSPNHRVSPGLVAGGALLLLVGEITVYFWYASAPRVVTPEWRAEFPRREASFKPVNLPPAAREILRFNEGESGSWRNVDGTRWQMIYLRWQPGRTAATLARNHTPEICLPAAGKNLRDIADLPRVDVMGLSLPFRCYTTEQNGRPLFVFYSLWEDGTGEQHLMTQLLTRRTRFEAVRERRRNPGQRVLQIGLWGARDAAHAEELLRAELPKLLFVTP